MLNNKIHLDFNVIITTFVVGKTVKPDRLTSNELN